MSETNNNLPTNHISNIEESEMYHVFIQTQKGSLIHTQMERKYVDTLDQYIDKLIKEETVVQFFIVNGVLAFKHTNL